MGVLDRDYVATKKYLDKKPLSYPDLIPSWRKGCRYYASQVPPHVQAVADRLWNKIQGFVNENATLGVFHVRRGDATTDHCDTELPHPKMQKYIKCSLKKSRTLGNLTILIQTDETDPNYIHNLTNMITMNGQRDHIQVVNLESLVLNVTTSYLDEIKLDQARWGDNFFIYMVLSVFRLQRAALTMERRRYFSCPDCDALVNKRSVHWAGKPKKKKKLK